MAFTRSDKWLLLIAGMPVLIIALCLTRWAGMEALYWYESNNGRTTSRSTVYGATDEQSFRELEQLKQSRDTAKLDGSALPNNWRIFPLTPSTRVRYVSAFIYSGGHLVPSMSKRRTPGLGFKIKVEEGAAKGPDLFIPAEDLAFGAY